MRRNRISDAAVAGIAVFNAGDCEIRANHVLGDGDPDSGRQAVDGIKLGCGPVIDSVIAENYLSGNLRDGHPHLGWRQAQLKPGEGCQLPADSIGL